MYRVVIIDHDPASRLQLRESLERHPDLTVVGEADGRLDGLELCERLSPEIVTIDTRLRNGDFETTVETLQKLDVSPVLCATSISDSDAWQVMKSGCDGMILKPFRDLAVERFVNHITRSTRVQQAMAQRSGERQFITIKSRRGLTVLPLEEVRYFYADQKYVMAVTPEGERVLDEALRHLEDKYDEYLLRVHRNALVCVEHVCGLKRLSSGQFQVELQGIEGGPIVSRRHLSRVRARLSSMS